VTFRAPDGASTAVRSARRAADGDWTVTVDDLRAPGRWRVTVTALRAGLPPSVASYDWSVADPAARPPIVSAAPLAPLLDPAAALVAIAALLLGVWLARRARRRPGPAAAATGTPAESPAAGPQAAGSPAAGSPAAGLQPAEPDPGVNAELLLQ
jgi:hypothetical protein